MEKEPQRFLVITIEACAEINPDLGEFIQATLDGARSMGSARAVGYRILDNEFEYEKWYNSPNRIQEVEVPEVKITKFEFD